MALGSHRGLAYKQKMKTVVRLKVTKISQFTKKQFRIYKLGKNLCTGKLKLMFGTSPRETACTDTGKYNEGRSHALQVSRHFIGTDASDAQQSSLAEQCLLPRPARTLRLGAPCTSQQGTGRTSWKVEWPEASAGRRKHLRSPQTRTASQVSGLFNSHPYLVLISVSVWLILICTHFCKKLIISTVLSRVL